ncbi:MAG: virulence protein RhuM/Fic/DOC family protein [Candidatus Doudnabacteria bacterium]|nr:virulence protein RhuM/Fic/DOC family protein [Candidatus Doudnabacteria bacterium]
MEETKNTQIEIYKAEQGPDLKVRFKGDTAWISLQEMADLFGRDKSVISRHLSAIFKENELNRKATVAKNATVQIEGGRPIERQIEYYNLDAIISVGYRVSSKRATQFRIWATQRLRDYLVKGYAVNEKRLKDFENLRGKLKDLEGAHKLIQNALDNKRLEGYEKELLRIISDYANTWFVLNAFDRDDLKIEDVTKRPARLLKHENLQKSITAFKKRLMAKREAGDLFGKEVGDKFQGVLGSIGQTFGEKELYPSLEEKAAHLLYFCIKDHPFADGNKRIGSLVFLLFLIDNNFLMNRRGERKINDTALAALALLIAESKPQDKEAMIKLVVNLINRK